MKLTHASVFSGIGGPEVAATMLGWDNLFHCEINPFGRAVLDYWYPSAKSYEDITTTDFSEWRGRVTVLTGGFPCQPFSYAGQRRGAQDDRYLWPYMFRCIDQVQPDWVVAENVAGITTMVEQGKVSPMAHQASLFDEDNGVQRYRLRETFTLERICQDLEGHGYEVQPVLIPACAVGARTEETECSSLQDVLLQTPTTVQTDEEPDKMRARAEKNGYKNGTKFGSLTSQIKYDPKVQNLLLPTPLAVEREHPDGVAALKATGADRINSRANGEQRPNGLIDFMQFYGMLPTPVTRDHKGISIKESKHRRGLMEEEGSTLPDVVDRLAKSQDAAHDGQTFRLSPLFTQEMMGFPFGWTELPFLSENGEQKP